MLKRPMDGRRFGMYWHILQTHTAAEVGFNRYVRLFPKDTWKYLWSKRPNESEKTVFLTGGREVHFKSGEKFDNLRVETLDGVIIDECREQDRRLWPQVVRPMLGRRKGWAEFYSTPNGFDWFYDLAESAKSKPDWGLFKAPSTEAWWWTPEEIESTKSDMSLPEYEQEILAEFRNLTAGRVYMLFSEDNKRFSCPWREGYQWSKYDPVVLGADFNLSPMAWNLGQLNASRWWWFDEIHLKNSYTQEAAFAFRDKILDMKLHGFEAEPNVIILGDATGKATQRTSNQSDYDILEQVLKDAKISFANRTPEANPSIKDRVNSVNSRCKNAKGEVNLWVHATKCKMLIHDMDRVTWKEGADFILDPGPLKELTHNSDGIGYPVHAMTPIKGSMVGKTRIIQRTV